MKQALGVEIYQDPEIDPMGDLDDFFAQVAALDLVISTSNTTVHVAGSQNIPCWVLLPWGRGALWYWFLERSDSPWYPSVRLYRQPRPEGGPEGSKMPDPPGGPWWTEAAARVGADLKAWVDSAVAGHD